MKKIIVFGIGARYKNNAKFLRSHYEIIAFADNSTDKQGRLIEGTPVISITQMKDYPYELVVVTPLVSREIVEQLLQCGITASKIALLSELDEQYTENELTDSSLRIAFQLVGGLGDYLIGANYICALKRKILPEDSLIDVYTNIKDASSIFGNHPGEIFNSHHPYSDLDENWQDNYHVCVILRRYPQILKMDVEYLSRRSGHVLGYLLECEKFRIYHQRFFSVHGIQTDSQGCLYEEVFRRKRIQQPDINEQLKLTENYVYSLPEYQGNEDEYLHSLGLKKKKYITVHRGTEKQYAGKSVKLWPLNQYKGFLEKLISIYPKVPIVQVGAAYDVCEELKGMGQDLVGQTGLEESKLLLKYSYLHIDNEGGLVHLRHAVHGGTSIVLFGPTSDSFFGYSENINIKGNGCGHWCEWVTGDWMIHCPRGFDIQPCMESINPEKVLQEVEKVFEQEKGI